MALAAEAAHLGVWELNTGTISYGCRRRRGELFQFKRAQHVTYRQFRGRAHPQDLATRDARDRRRSKEADDEKNIVIYFLMDIAWLPAWLVASSIKTAIRRACPASRWM